MGADTRVSALTGAPSRLKIPWVLFQGCLHPGDALANEFFLVFRQAHGMISGPKHDEPFGHAGLCVNAMGLGWGNDPVRIAVEYQNVLDIVDLIEDIEIEAGDSGLHGKALWFVILPEIGLVDGFAAQGRRIGDDGMGGELPGCGQNRRAPQAAADHAETIPDLLQRPHSFYSHDEIRAPAVKGCHLIELPVAFAASAVVEPEIGHPLGNTGFGQPELLDGLRVAAQSVRSDDHRNLDWICGEMQVSLERKAVALKCHFSILGDHVVVGHTSIPRLG